MRMTRRTDQRRAGKSCGGLRAMEINRNTHSCEAPTFRFSMVVRKPPLYYSQPSSVLLDPAAATSSISHSFLETISSFRFQDHIIIWFSFLLFSPSPLFWLTAPYLLDFISLGDPRAHPPEPLLCSTYMPWKISFNLVASQIIYMPMMPQFLSPVRTSVMNSRLVCPIDSLVPPLECS